MPHMHIKELKKPTFPAVQGDSKFLFIATNDIDENEKLISTQLEGENFFLLAKKTEDKNLLKIDKLSRPSKNHITKKALLDYAALSECEVLSSNVHEAEQNIHLQENSSLKKIEDFASYFPTDRELSIEVGFGSGRHLLHQAVSNPHILYIGIEIHKPSVEQVLKQITIQKIDNILLLNYDARLFMELVPSNLVRTIYVHFPVPWDKKPHRRVISRAFLDESIRVLKKSGRLELRTDSDNYFNYSFETFISLKNVSLEIHKNREIEITSKYEDRWRRMEKNIYDVTMIVDEDSPELSLQDTFDFRGDLKSAEKILELKNSTKKLSDGFIHFERLYKVENGTIIFRIAMGSFDRPEHLYIILDEDVKYFPNSPVRTKTNLKIHKFLNEILHG